MTTEPVFEITDTSIVWTGDGETLRVEAWGQDSVRVRAALKVDIKDADWALLAPAASPALVVVDGDLAVLTNGEISVELRNERWQDLAAGYVRFRCHLRFLNAAGEVLLEELRPGGSLKLEGREWQAINGGGHRLVAAFEAQPGEMLFGMGQYQDGIFDLKGATLELAHRNSQASVPFLLSNRGYGFFWHNPAIGRATFATTRTEWVAESTAMLDYWVTAGATPAAICSNYADATGHAPSMPDRGLGLWQSKLRYASQDELLAVAREYRERGLPLDVIVADFFHWPKMGDFRFEDDFWPDPAGMVQELKDLDIDLMVSVWPQVSIESENYERFRKNNALIHTERGVDIHMGFEGPSAFADMTSERGRRILWDIIRRNYFDAGIRTFWLDEAEPEFGMYDWDNYLYSAGPALQVANIYPQHFSRALYEGQRESGQENIVNLVRCAWAGSQRYGALVWSGDIYTTWDDLRHQLIAGLQMGIAGIPWFTTDIGGFHNGNPDDPGFRELLIRWFQFATFCPVLRMHGDRKPSHPVVASDGGRRLPSGADNELWSFGPEAYDVLAFYARLREELRPYLRRVMDDASANGQPVMRTLFHSFPNDLNAWHVSSQYMLGPDILVAPILEPGATQREVYLPDQASWTELFTGRVLEGGSIYTVEAQLDVIPVFIRDGAVSIDLPAREPAEESL